jgi:hypothetical protein
VSFAVSADQPILLELAVLGRLEGVIPPTTTTTTTTSTTTTVVRRTRPGRPRPTPAPPIAREPRPVETPDVAPINATVAVRVHLPAGDRTAVAEALDGDPRDAFDRIEYSLADVLAVGGGEPQVQLSVPTSSGLATAETLTLRDPGLYPISVEIRVDDETVAAHVTMIERTAVDAPSSTFDLAVLARTPAGGPQPSAAELTRARDDLEAMAALGVAAEGAVSLSIPPALVARLVEQDPGLGQRLRTALEGDEVLSVPVYELDPSSAAATDAVDTFTDYLRTGEDVLDKVLPATPARRAAWVVDRPLSQPAADALRNLGYRLLVMDAAVYGQTEGSIGGFTDSTLVVGVRLTDNGSLPTLVTTGWAPLLDPVRPAGDVTSPADRAVRLAADALALRAEFDPELERAAVLTTPALGVPDALTVAALARFVEQSPELRMVPLSALPGDADPIAIDGQPLTLTLPSTAGPDLAAREEQIANTSLSAASAASMLPTGDPRPAAWQAELDTLLSTGLDDEEAAAALAEINGAADEVRDSVVPPPPFTFTLTGRSDELRLRIGNDADVALNITVRPSSPKLEFPEGDQAVELAPGAFTNVEMPVEARSNGTSSVGIELITPLGERFVDPIVLTAHVTALSGLGQVITGGALLVLLAWWGSHVRRNRLRRRAALQPAGAFGDPDANGDAPAVSPDAAEATVSYAPVVDSVPDP